MKRFIAIDSTYRNRSSYPNPADFVIPYGSNIGSNNASNAIDPVTNEGQIYPSININPLAFYEENADPVVPDGTILWRGYLPFMYQLESGQVYVDELPLASTSSTNLSIIGNNTRNVYPLQEATNVYNNYVLENVNNQNMAVIESSSFTLGKVILQTFVVESYTVDTSGFHFTVYLFNPNSYPPSNIDRYYQGKYVTFSGSIALITNYFINSDNRAQFDIDTNLSLTNGSVVEIVTDRQTVLTISDSSFTSIIPPYPAYRYPLPSSLLAGKKITNISHNETNIVHVRAVRQNDNTFGIAFLVDDGQTSGGYPVGKLFYMSSVDENGVFFPNAETQVDLTGLFPDQRTNMGLAIINNVPNIVINTVDTTASTGAIYNTTYVSAGDNHGGTWTSVTQVVLGAVDGPVPVQSMNMANNPPFFVTTDGSGNLYQYDGNPPITPSLLVTPDAIMKDCCNVGNGLAGSIIYTQYDLLYYDILYGGGTVQVSNFLVEGMASVCEIYDPFFPNSLNAFVVYILKNTNDLYVNYTDGWFYGFPEQLVATDVAPEKLCKVVTGPNKSPVIIYKAMDGIRVITTDIYVTAPGLEKYIWNDSVLIDSITSTTTLDAVTGVDDNPYIVYNGPVTQLNVISLGSVFIEKGLMYNIRLNRPIRTNTYIQDGGSNFVSVFETLPSSMNQYVQLQSRQFIDYQVSTISVAYNANIALINQYPCIVYTSTITPPPSPTTISLHIAMNSQIDGNGVWTVNNTGVIIDASNFPDRHLCQYGICGVNGIPSIAYIADDSFGDPALYFGQTQYPDGSGAFTSTFLDYPGADHSYITLLMVDDMPMVFYIYSWDFTIRYAFYGLFPYQDPATDAPSWHHNTTPFEGYGVTAKVVNGFPCVAFYNLTTELIYAVNTQRDTFGDWTTTSVYTTTPLFYPPTYLRQLWITTTVLEDGTEEPFILFQPDIVTGHSFHNNVWSSQIIPIPAISSRAVARTLYNKPIIFYGDFDPILETKYFVARETSPMVWTTQVVANQLGDFSLALAVNEQDIPIFVYNPTFARGEVKYGIQFNTIPDQLNNIRLIKTQTGSTLGVASPFSYNLVNMLFNSQVSWEILSFAYDNYNPLAYNGSVVSQQQEVCYDIELKSITLPNKILQTGNGNRIAFYPYIYVIFSAYDKFYQLQSNNPSAVYALFSIGIYNVSSPDSASFVVLDGRGMTQRIKFKPNSFFQFKVLLPNGDVFRVSPDTVPPILPDPSVQISAVFSFKRIQNDLPHDACCGFL